MTRIGVVAALEAEVRTLRKLPAHFAVSVSGMGAESAYRAARRLIEGGATALVSWGCAAALDPALRPGALLLPETILRPDGARFAADREWRRAIADCLRAVEDAALHAETPHVLHTPADKRALAARTQARSADMESGAIARAAAEARVPFIAIRAVADSVTMDMPAPLARAVGGDGRVALAGIARLAMAPWHWPAALRTGAAFNAALQALRVAAPALYASGAADAAGSAHTYVRA